MKCKKCNKVNTEDAKFCEKCGSALSSESDGGSVDTYFAKTYKACQTCGSMAPTKYIELYQNMGFVVMRRYRNIKGRLCKACINKYFWEMTLITLILGWWGTISFLVTPFYLINNIGRYVTTLGMEYKEK